MLAAVPGSALASAQQRLQGGPMPPGGAGGSLAAGMPLGGPPGGGIQAQLHCLEKQYQLQKDMLNRQFEEQRRLLELEQQAQMHDYIKVRGCS